jgi:energy-dependent translational throttle protein EttA
VSTGTVVAITHDRYFLESSCNWILELDRGEAYPFEGNYSGWLEKKAERAAAEAKVYHYITYFHYDHYMT